MVRLYINRLKCIVRNREAIFWTLLFPFILATCFYFAFQNINSVMEFETISVAIVSDLSDTAIKHQDMVLALREAKTESGELMFNVNHASLEDAQNSLYHKEIDGYITLAGETELVVADSGINQTILKEFIDSYLQRSHMAKDIVESNPTVLQGDFLQNVTANKEYIVENNSEKKPDLMLLYFYSLLAFTCMFAASIGMDEVINIQADMSEVAARLNVSGTGKLKLFLCNMFAAITVNSVALGALFFYMKDILGISFGDHMGLIALTCLVGSLVGMFFGSTICIWIKKEKETKEAILTSVQMLFAGLAGMFGTGEIKYLIADKLPLFSYINPTNLITDCLYSLYYYKTLDRFVVNFMLLLAMAIVLFGISYLGIRRKTYASI